MTEATYSELIEVAGAAAERAFNAALTSEPADAEHLAAALTRLDYYGRVHLDLLRGGGRLARTTTRTAAPWSDLRPGEGDPAIAALERTADLLGAAHDLLASHVHRGQTRTRHGELLDDQEWCQSAMTLVSCVLSTGQAVAAVARNVSLAPTRLTAATPAPAAIRLLVAARLDPDPALIPNAAVDRPGDPARHALQAADRIDVALHQQRHGQLPAGLADLILTADAAVRVAGYHAVVTTALRRRAPDLGLKTDHDALTQQAEESLATCQKWRQARDALRGFASTALGSRWVRSELDALRTALADLASPNAMRPEAAAALMPDTATARAHQRTSDALMLHVATWSEASPALFTKLRPSLLVPTRNLPDVDVPYAWAPAPWTNTANAAAQIEALTPSRSARLPPPPRTHPTPPAAPRRRPSRITDEHARV